MPAVRTLLADATAQLTAAGVGSPRVDAELLLADLLGRPRTALVTLDEVPASVAAAFGAAVERRAARVPLQHITGHAPFRHVELAVGPGVFVPRPETELLVDAVLSHLRAVTGREPLAVDLCAGSGPLALALADEVPGVRVLAVESGQDAARWLTRNVAASSAAARVRVLVGDIADPELLAGLHGRVDVVVSNPPYVPAGVPVSPEVRADPSQAVFAGPDGLDLLPVVAHRAACLLRPGGVFAVEHDDTHASAVPELLAADGRWVGIADHLDLAGRPRFATATRGPRPDPRPHGAPATTAIPAR